MASFQYINKSLINHYGGDGGRLQISRAKLPIALKTIILNKMP